MKNNALLGITISRETGQTITAQVYSSIQQRIVSGKIASGSVLPPTRGLASDLGISRSTIIVAYEQLAAEGYIEGRQGSGYVVCPLGAVEFNEKIPYQGDPKTPSNPAEHFSAEHSDPLQGPLPFRPGWPDMRLFPYAQWARHVARIARTSPKSLITGGGTFGDMHLREAIATHIAEWRGVDASPRQIMITAGSGDAVEICIRSLTMEGRSIGMENPGYRPLQHFIASLGIETQWLNIDPSGAELPQGNSKIPPPKLVVLTPSHQFPLGGTMPPARRIEYLNWAEQSGSWIIEDDYDSEFRYAGRPIPAMAGLDKNGRTIYVGSFSKIFSNSLRLGYLVIPEPLLSRFEDTITRFGKKASISPQRPLATFISQGEFYRHLRRMRRIYGDRRRGLIDLLKRQLGDQFDAADHQAGMQIVLKLRPTYDDTAIAEAAKIRGLLPRALSTYYATNTKETGLLLGFCTHSAEELEDPVKELCGIIRPTQVT